MEFTSEKIKKLANIVCIELESEEQEAFTQELTAMVAWVNKLKKVDTAGFPSHFAMCSEQYTLGKDQPVEAPLSLKKVLNNAPVHDGVYFHVPPTSTQQEDDKRLE